MKLTWCSDGRCPDRANEEDSKFRKMHLDLQLMDQSGIECGSVKVGLVQGAGAEFIYTEPRTRHLTWVRRGLSMSRRQPGGRLICGPWHGSCSGIMAVNSRISPANLCCIMLASIGSVADASARRKGPEWYKAPHAAEDPG
jgi:hypothetical protein